MQLCQKLRSEHGGIGDNLSEDRPTVNEDGSWARLLGKAGGIVFCRAESPVIEDFNKLDTMMKVWNSASRGERGFDQRIQ
mmetsp:Transcript_38344/g.81846  ORF Transcript_38344/g.81846 Transcript_38344/m.81846 type:complete len:80 (-) Transcript_38344:410-649(-)